MDAVSCGSPEGPPPRYQLLEHTLTRSLGGTISLRPECPQERGCSWGLLRLGRNFSLHRWVQARSGAKSLHMVGPSSTRFRRGSEIPHEGKGWRTGLGSNRNPGGRLLQPSRRESSVSLLQPRRRESSVSSRGLAEMNFILNTDVRIGH